jgi:AcrR family transcriptional regulator
MAAMPRRARYHHGDLPEALLAAAEQLVAEHGLEAFSLREAARAVGVDPAACYRHFRNRDDVIHALARRGFTRLVRKMERASGHHKDPEETLRALGRAYVAFARERPVDFRIMFGPNGVGARDPRLRGDYERGGIDILTAAVARFLDRPTGSSDPYVMALWAAVHGVACLTVDDAWRLDAADADRVLETVLDRMLVVVTPSGGSASRGASRGGRGARRG